MKVVFSHSLPFSLAHGGMQTLIESLMRELSVAGVEVEPERWWDPDQTCDVMHFVQRPPQGNAELAKQKGRKLLMTENYDVVASESRSRLFMRTLATRSARAIVPGFDRRLSFYRELDALVYVVPHEWVVVRQIYGLPPERGYVIPHGLEPSVIDALGKAEPECDYLVSVGTICPRKNTVLLAQCARQAKIPVVFVGKPFSEDDPYFIEFQRLIDDKYVQFAGWVAEDEKYKILRGARGFVLLSRGESGCIAAHEASAAKLPLFVSDLPWAANGYPASDRLHLVSLRNAKGIAARLKSFYEGAHRGNAMTFPIRTWAEVAQMYLEVYKKL
jgi:glycosyltransferase involved in cell wall biosynthesis